MKTLFEQVDHTEEFGCKLVTDEMETKFWSCKFIWSGQKNLTKMEKLVF